MSTRRPEHLAAEIQRAVQQIIAKGLQDPRISGLITVTSVKVTQDCKQATILVSVLPEEKQELTMHGLKAAERHIRHEAGELVRTREMPQFLFRVDSSLKKEAGVLRELERVRDEREDGDSAGWGKPREGNGGGA